MAATAAAANKARLFVVRDTDVAGHLQALAREGFECQSLAHVRDIPLAGETRMRTSINAGVAQPVLLLLDAEAFAEAWENDQFRLKYLTRKHVGVIVLHPQAGEPLPERMAESVLDELYRPYTVTALCRSARNAAALLQLEAEKAGLRRELGRRTRQLRDVINIGIALSGERDLEVLLEKILENARAFTGADAGSIYLVDGAQRDTLRFVWAQNDSLDEVPFKTFTMPLDTSSIAGCCAVLKQVVNIEDAYQIPPTAPYTLNRSWDESVGYRTKSILCVPMIDHNGEVLGVLQLINRKREPREMLANPPADVETAVIPFDIDNQAIVSSFASQAAVALNNSILLKNIEELIEGLVRGAVVAIESRDPTTSGHTERVTELTVALAEAVNRCTSGRYAETHFSAEALRELRYAGLLHDFGKVGVREAVLVKAKKLYPGMLEVIEQRFEAMKGRLEGRLWRKALEALESDSITAEAVRQRHAEVETRLRREQAKIDHYVELVRQANEPSVLGEHVAEELATLGQLTWKDSRGERQPCLTEAELGYLSIERGSLTPEERAEIESHARHSWEFLQQIPWTRDLKNLPLIAATHHEKLNGKGYPFGLVEREIPLGGKIMAVADIFDALTAHDRPYKKAMPVEKALNVLREEAANGHLDAELVELFVRERVYETRSTPRQSQEDERGEAVRKAVESAG